MAARRQLGGATAVPRSSAIVARQLSDFPITKLRFSPFDKRQLVSCGRENCHTTAASAAATGDSTAMSLRYRYKPERFTITAPATAMLVTTTTSTHYRRRCLPACPAVLNEFARGAEFTDLAFDSAYGMAATTASGISSSSATSSNAAAAAAHPVVGQHIVYVSTRAGTVMQQKTLAQLCARKRLQCTSIGYETRSLLCVLRLHDGPIRALAVHEGFAVTASEDCWVRLWPLDFSDYLMEASHTTCIATLVDRVDYLMHTPVVSAMRACFCLSLQHVRLVVMLKAKHEAPVVAIALSADGLRIAVGTAG
eukprot:10330-Heterococcus_DN1.PRE.1